MRGDLQGAGGAGFRQHVSGARPSLPYRVRRAVAARRGPAAVAAAIGLATEAPGKTPGRRWCVVRAGQAGTFHFSWSAFCLPAVLDVAGRVEPWSNAVERPAFGGDMTLERRGWLRSTARLRGRSCVQWRGLCIGGRLGTDPTGAAARLFAATEAVTETPRGRGIPAVLDVAGRVEPWSTAVERRAFGGDMTLERRGWLRSTARLRWRSCVQWRGPCIGGRLGTDPTKASGPGRLQYGQPQDVEVLGPAFGLARDGPACLFHRRQYDARVCWSESCRVEGAARLGFNSPA